MDSRIDDTARSFLTEQPVGTLTTLRADGKARVTLVYFALAGDRIQISTERGRGKARDVERTGWASFCVMGHARPFPSLTLEGAARILSEGIGDATAKVLARITGARPDTPPSDAQLAAAGRVILEIDIERIYGVSYVAQPGKA